MATNSRKGRFTEHGIELLRELKREDIPQFNDLRLRNLKDEMNHLSEELEIVYAEIEELQRHAQEGEDIRDCDNVRYNVVQHTLLRNKRIGLSYLRERLTRVENLYWTYRHIPNDTKKKLDQSEVDHYNEYRGLMQQYMEDIQGDTDIDFQLNEFISPPKPGTAYYKVQILKDLGYVASSEDMTDNLLVKGDIVSMSMTEVEPLLVDGSAKLLDSVALTLSK
eukprot:TRINITY_DN779967_c0_g1_i1.p1 TRINITY_DN779967_c0_g1~~TRINITY_DN779967_c0_g1_i1.p1  ORF type:complete len:222 (+),score=36.73 TRINITY_DN779967_c0_g1_i1:73-738(+)